MLVLIYQINRCKISEDRDLTLTPSSGYPEIWYQHFGRIFCLHLQGTMKHGTTFSEEPSVSVFNVAWNTVWTFRRDLMSPSSYHKPALSFPNGVTTHKTVELPHSVTTGYFVGIMSHGSNVLWSLYTPMASCTPTVGTERANTMPALWSALLGLLAGEAIVIWGGSCNFHFWT
jgi:hypothetical protein